MAIVQLGPIVPANCCCISTNYNSKTERICSWSNLVRSYRIKRCRISVRCGSRVSIGSRRSGTRCTWKLDAVDARVVERSSSSGNAHGITGVVDIPVSCYQVNELIYSFDIFYLACLLIVVCVVV